MKTTLSWIACLNKFSCFIRILLKIIIKEKEIIVRKMGKYRRVEIDWQSSTGVTKPQRIYIIVHCGFRANSFSTPNLLVYKCTFYGG